VHHCDSWRIRDQLDVTIYYVSFHFFYAQHVSDINTSIVRSLRLFYCITTLVVCSCFDVCWSFGVARLGWCLPHGYHQTRPKVHRAVAKYDEMICKYGTVMCNKRPKNPTSVTVHSCLQILDYILLVQLRTGHPPGGLCLEITKFNHPKHTLSKFCMKAKLQHHENHSQYTL